MEDKRLESETRKPKWRRTGGMCRMSNGRIVKPGQTVYAFAAELGSRQRWQLLDDPCSAKSFPQPGSVQDESLVALEIVHRTRGWYDVINPKTGVKVNDRPLRAEEAKLLAGGGEAKEEEAAEAAQTGLEASGGDEAGNDIDKEGE